MWWQGINGVGGSLSFYFPANEVVVQMLWLPASETSTVITQGGERCRTEIAAWFAPERNLNHSGMAFNLGSFWGLVGPCSRKLCEIFVPICFEAVVPVCSYPHFFLFLHVPICSCFRLASSGIVLLSKIVLRWYRTRQADAWDARTQLKDVQRKFPWFYLLHFMAFCSSSMFIGSLILTVPCNTPPPSQKSSRALRLSLAPRKAGQAKKRQLRSEMLKTRQAFLHRHCSSCFYMVFACAYIILRSLVFYSVL